MKVSASSLPFRVFSHNPLAHREHLLFDVHKPTPYLKVSSLFSWVYVEPVKWHLHRHWLLRDIQKQDPLSPLSLKVFLYSFCWKLYWEKTDLVTARTLLQYSASTGKQHTKWRIKQNQNLVLYRCLANLAWNLYIYFLSSTTDNPPSVI